MVQSRIEQTWRRVRSELPARFRFDFSPAEAAVDLAVREALVTYGRGLVLDAGCGDMPYRGVVETSIGDYLGVDIEPKTPDAIRGDVQDLRLFDANSVDTILCSEVLEHLPHPDLATGEFYRVLRPGGRLILTVPFLARLHEEPHDYFRFTSHGVQVILENSGFSVVELRAIGGIVSFLSHQMITAALSLAWDRRVLRRLLLVVISRIVSPASLWIDDRLPTKRLIPLGYLAVAVVPPE